MGTAAAFLDGGYVEKVLHYDHNEPKIDFEKLVHIMVNINAEPLASRVRKSKLVDRPQN
jgi:hypothetical protein